MKGLTYVPGLSLFAIIAFVSIAGHLPISENFRKFGLLLLCLIPFCILGEFFAFGYDVWKREDRLFSHAFAPRLAFHLLATFVSIGVLALGVGFMRMGPIGPG